MTVHIVRAERSGNVSTVTIELKDAEGEPIMTSVSELNFTTPVKTTKTVTFGDLNYQLTAEYNGRNYNYTLDGVSGRIRMRNIVMDNELLYIYLRGWDLESGDPRSVRVADPFAKTAEPLTARLASTTTFSLPGRGEVNCVVMRIVRTEAPIGTPIYVTYTRKEAFSEFGSFRLPVRIVENNLVYTLTGVDISD
jgi:hypothetical protein